MRQHPWLYLLWIGILTLSGCTQYQAVPASKTRDIGGIFQVTPQTSWSTIKKGNREIWTVNGASLESIVFVTSIKSGESLIDHSATSKDDRPVYRDGMKAPDVVDLFEATLISNRYSQIEISKIRPVQKNGKTAFRFDFSAYDATGLKKRGFVFATMNASNGLSLVVYEAAAEHYFSAYSDEAEAILESLKII